MALALAFYEEATAMDYGGPHGPVGFDVIKAVENLSFTWGVGLAFFLGATFNMYFSRNDGDGY